MVVSDFNEAAWIKVEKAQLQVDSAPYPKPKADEIVVKNAYVAINPVDWKIQTYAPPNQKYPEILGRDLAGEVIEVGKDVSRLKVGQRVIAHALGRATTNPSHGAFQLYPLAHEITTAPIPDSLPYEQAVVLPLAISTAAAGLYQKGFLELPYPMTDAKSSGKTILIWGGSSSVGSATIQLAVASGLEVISTASKKNFDFVKSLGAKHVYDHSNSNTVKDIVAALKETDFVGAYDAISLPESINPTIEIVHQLGGGKVSTVLPYTGDLPSNVTTHQVGAVSIATDQPEVGKAVWGNYIPAALADGFFQAKPDPIIIKGGLSSVQEALDTLRKGVSAAKVVVEL